VPGAETDAGAHRAFVLLYLPQSARWRRIDECAPRVLFSDLGLMELVGFNAHQCEDGLTKRGDAQRPHEKEAGTDQPQCLADNISKLGEQEMERLFNRMVQLLARRGMFHRQAAGRPGWQ